MIGHRGHGHPSYNSTSRHRGVYRCIVILTSVYIFFPGKKILLLIFIMLNQIVQKIHDPNTWIFRMIPQAVPCKNSLYMIKKKSGNVHHIQNIPEDYANDLQ